MKLLKKISVLLSMLLLTVCLATPIHAEAASLNKTKATVTVGKTVTLKLTGTSKKKTWKSSNKSVATVTSKGVVKGVKAGTATITVKYGTATKKCKVTVKNANATAKNITFKTTDGGDFITKASKATATFKLSNKSTAVKLQILNTSGTVVRAKTFATCKGDTKYSWTWDGKNSKGNYVSKGSYRVRIIAGSKKTTSSKYLKVITTNPFAGGTGSKSKPYQVKTFAQLNKINSYPTKHFIQKANIDAGYSNMTPLCTIDAPFSGSYNGNGYSINNLILSQPGSAALFIASSGTINNVKMNRISSAGTAWGANDIAALVGMNTGKINNCTINTPVISGETGNRCGAIAGTNRGTITECTVNSATVTGSSYSNNSPGMAGIAGINESVIVDCTVNGITVKGWQIGGIVGVNGSSGQVINCETIGTCTFDGDVNRAGSIIGWNDGAYPGCTTDTGFQLIGRRYK